MKKVLYIDMDNVLVDFPSGVAQLDETDIAGLSDEEIEREVKSSPLLKPDSSITMKKSESGFTFVNFNFETE